MKKLLLIFLVLVSFASYGQRIQKANTYGLAFNRTGADTLFYLPNDTFTVPAAYLTYPFMARKGANVYIWNTSSNVWQGLTGGTLDTTGAFVTSVYRRSDSVFYVKGGVHTFAFKDSTGGSIPTLQQVLTAGSTLTTDHTIDFGGNDFILKGDSVVIKDPSGNERITFAPNGNPIEGDNSRIKFINADGAKMVIQSGDEYLETLTGWAIRNNIGYNPALSVNGSFLSSSIPQTAPLVEVIQDGETLFQVANDSIFFRPPLGRFLIDTLNYTLSTTGKKILIRDTATGLVQNIDPSLLGASSYTFTNGITESGGTVKLGGTQTENINIDGSSAYGVNFLNSDGFQVSGTGDLSASMGNVTIQASGLSTSGISLATTYLARHSEIDFDVDTIFINPGFGRLIIDTLTSAVGTKALRYNPTTGLVSYADTTGGGGSDGYVDNATFNTTTNYLTIEQTGAADVSVRIPPSYIINPINADSLTRIVNDSTLMVKAVVIADTDPVEVTTVRNDSLNTHTIAIRQTFLDSIRNGDFGGGSTSPGGNYGNLQINRNGAFATPASDSLSFNSAKLTVKGKLQTTDTLTTTHARVAGMDVGVYGGAVGFQNDAANTGKTGMYFRTFSGGSTNGPIVFESGSFKAQMIVSDAAQNQFQVVYGGNTGYINVGSHMNVYASGSQELRLGAGGTLNLLTLLGSGRMGVGVTAPTGMIHLKAGTASANTAPFKLTSGTNLSTPEAGAMEYNGTNLFFTPSSAARNNILMTASVNSVSPTSPNRTITVVIDGTTYYIHAKTTND